jgi:hypothetical protein
MDSQSMGKKRGSSMTPEIAARYQRVHDAWEREHGNFAPPLKFEVPRGQYVNLGISIAFGDSIIDEHRCYAENMGSKRRWLTVVWVVAAIGVLAELIAGLASGFAPSFFDLPPWVWILIYLSIGVWAYWYSPRMKRASSHIFDRDEGKIYIYGGKGFPHFAFDFYDSYFFIQGGHADHVRSASLYFFIPKFTWEGKEQGGFPMRMAFTGSEQEALMAWYFLVRYMDKSWPFDAEEYEYFDYVRKEKERYGYKVEGIRYEDGRVEVL